MSGGDLTAIFIAFAAYLIFMVIIGALYMKKTESVEDYILGGRGLSGWVAAFSAQASDMSGWLLMGLRARSTRRERDRSGLLWDCSAERFSTGSASLRDCAGILSRRIIP